MKKVSIKLKKLSVRKKLFKFGSIVNARDHDIEFFGNGQDDATAVRVDALFFEPMPKSIAMCDTIYRLVTPVIITLVEWIYK